MALRLVVGGSLRPIFNNQVRNASALSAKQVLEQQPAPELTTLKNGFRVVTEENGRETATVGVFIETGSRFETEANNGVAHFLERLIHRGTAKRTGAALTNELEQIGAKLQSRTGRNFTYFLVQSASGDVEKVVDILADVLRNSKLDAASVEEERKILLAELEESDNLYRDVCFNYLHSAAYQGTNLARSWLGTTESIKKISAQQLKEWVEDNYKATRMVMTGVGGNVSQVSRLAEKYFGDLDNVYPRKVPDPDGIRFTGSEFLYRNDYIPNMHACIAVEGVGYGHHDALALQVASQFVGQWDVTHALTRTAPSRLVQKISHDHGLKYFENFNINYKDTGLWGVYYISDGKELNETYGIMKSVQREWKHLASAISDDETAMARNQFRTNFFTKLESNTGRAKFYGREALYTDGVRSLVDMEDQISRIDHTTLREAISRHVYDRDIASSGVGRTEAFPPYTFLRYGMSWWRL
ncbi:hypothetical protein WR25_21861 [Diploscapter pachys]|uniref:Mitochondrial-processing peptidase subunit beta n=1 Tax=Diploscapter pachys TaxID=2018661 RepID=A0A2A2LCM6_9BILA|nr:hypothetical protein WR25_21861 [Diploscapter pachys]